MPARYLLIDGYNVIYAHKPLAELAEQSLYAARIKLMDTLVEYKAMCVYRIIVVFDAHLVAGGVGSDSDYINIKVVFTKEAETADHYIERAAYKLSRNPAKKDHVTVATSDILEQIIILGSNSARVSAEDLWRQIETTKNNMRAKHIENRPIKKNPFEGFLDKKTAKILNEMRFK